MIAPRGGFFTRDGRWAVENEGVAPDIDVENYPKDIIAGRDPQLERAVQEAMRMLCEGRTTFVIAQRFSTVQHADQILVLNEGRIVERGRHDELIQRSGFYREVFEQQIKH